MIICFIYSLMLFVTKVVNKHESIICPAHVHNRVSCSPSVIMVLYYCCAALVYICKHIYITAVCS